MASAPVLPAFEAWMGSVGIEWSRDAIELVERQPGCSGLALAVRAVRDVAEDDLLCRIPKAACLTTRTTSIADVLEAELLGGGLGLTVAVMHEAALGAESRWHGYFQALPRREYLPLFWTDDELDLLEATDIREQAEADRQLTEDDYEENVAPLLEQYGGRLAGGEAMGLAAFRAASSLVASRAFGIDDYHGMGMVPLADVFNHKASVVDLAPGYVVHGADSSDSDSGSDSGSDGDGGGGSDEEANSGDSADEAEDNGGGKEAAAAGAAAAAAGAAAGAAAAAAAAGAAPPSIMRASGQAASIHGVSSANGLHLRLQMAIVDGDEELRIVAASDIPRGAEVHNTYGELGNGELVAKYGFALRENPFTVVTLDKEEDLREAITSVLRGQGRRWAPDFEAHVELLMEETELMEMDEEPFQVLPNGHINFSLFAALRVLCGPPAGPVRRWASVEEALAHPTATGLEVGGVVAIGAAAGGEGGGWGQLLTQTMLKSLRAAVSYRLERYGGDFAAQSLAALEREAPPPGEHSSALRAAYTLLTTESEILRDALAALQPLIAAERPAGEPRQRGAAAGGAARGKRRKP